MSCVASIKHAVEVFVHTAAGSSSYFYIVSVALIIRHLVLYFFFWDLHSLHFLHNLMLSINLRMRTTFSIRQAWPKPSMIIIVLVFHYTMQWLTERLCFHSSVLVRYCYLLIPPLERPPRGLLLTKSWNCLTQPIFSLCEYTSKCFFSIWYDNCILESLFLVDFEQLYFVYN